jgi:hypothetical protein
MEFFILDISSKILKFLNFPENFYKYYLKMSKISKFLENFTEILINVFVTLLKFQKYSYNPNIRNIL